MKEETLEKVKTVETDQCCRFVDALTHYECLIAEGDDPFYDDEILKSYMSKWAGPEFFTALGELQGKHVAEIGVGTGRLAKRILELGCSHFTGIDISPSTIAKARLNLKQYNNMDLIVADAEAYTSIEAYDVIYSVLTFMHLKDKRKTISNIVNSLKPNGIAVVSISRQDKVITCGNRKIELYIDSASDCAEIFRLNGCIVEPLIDVVDFFTFPNGEKDSTYGRVATTIVKAVKPMDSHTI